MHPMNAMVVFIVTPPMVRLVAEILAILPSTDIFVIFISGNVSPSRLKPFPNSTVPSCRKASGLLGPLHPPPHVVSAGGQPPPNWFLIHEGSEDIVAVKFMLSLLPYLQLLVLISAKKFLTMKKPCTWSVTVSFVTSN